MTKKRTRAATRRKAPKGATARKRQPTKRRDPDLEAFKELKAGVVAQLKARAVTMPEIELFATASGSESRAFTPQELVAEIEKETPLGKQLLRSAMVLSTTRALSRNPAE